MKGLILCFCALPALAGEYAVLSNGFRVHAESHERRGTVMRLRTEAGAIEFPAEFVAGFEADEVIAVPPAKTLNPVPELKPAKTVQELVADAARKAELPEAIVHAVAKAESGYRQDAISRKGAIGIMQLMPGTAKALNADPYDAAQNADAGARYLREMLIRYDGDVAKALAAYNAGPGAVDKYGAVPPFSETRTYVNRVIRNYNKLGGE